MTTQNFVTLPREVVEQTLNALAIADNIALVGKAYTPKAIDLGIGKIRGATDQLRAAIADALAKKDTRNPMFTFRECEDSQVMQMPDYEQSETYLRTQSGLTKPQDHLQEIASFVGVDALRDVLEQAAQECETQEDYGPRHETPRDCAAAIRAMIGEIK